MKTKAELASELRDTKEDLQELRFKFTAVIEDRDKLDREASNYRKQLTDEYGSIIDILTDMSVQFKTIGIQLSKDAPMSVLPVAQHYADKFITPTLDHHSLSERKRTYNHIIDVILDDWVDWRYVVIQIAKTDPALVILASNKSCWKNQVALYAKQHPGEKIKCIKLCRELTNMGLKEAKDYVESLNVYGSINKAF